MMVFNLFSQDEDQNTLLLFKEHSKRMSLIANFEPPNRTKQKKTYLKGSNPKAHGINSQLDDHKFMFHSNTAAEVRSQV